jgi:DNA-binding transcriptional LysR family regulator
MDVKRLQHLRLAVEAGSISAAAAALGLSQPALTKSIRGLEAELGVALLERRARGVVPTACGEALLRRAGPVSVLLGDALREIAALRGGPREEAAIGAGALPRFAAAQARVAPITIVINQSPWLDSFRRTVEL